MAAVRADCYFHTRKRLWSLRVNGKVIDHRPRAALSGCRMVVREGERQRCIARGQRSVHAWITGTLTPPPRIDEAFVEIGYSPFLFGAFTVRPGFLPIWEANIVVFAQDGRAWALVSGIEQLETVV